MDEKLKSIKEKYLELEKKLSNPEILNDYKKLKTISKQKSDIEDIITKYDLYLKAGKDIEELNHIEDDEMYALAKDEIKNLEDERKKLLEEIKVLLIPKDENDDKNIIMEIRGAAGGDEANIFAGDLYRMYTRYAEKNNWKMELIHSVDGTSGGFSQIEFLIKGENVYSKLKYESGAHRVQRVPETESQGRVHTSTATVLVMPETDDINIDIKESDIKTDVYHSSGAGGQSVNTTNSAVRLTHIPTGIVVTCQNERSQIKNKEQAMKVLKAKIYDEEQRKKEQIEGNERKSKIGTGDRSEKIRTYNYPQNRVTDHRINFSVMNLDKVMDGNLDEIIESLIIEDQRLKLEGSGLNEN